MQNRPRQSSMFWLGQSASSLHMVALGSATVGAAAGLAILARPRTFTASIQAQPTKFNQALLSLCPTLSAPYSLPGLLCNGHVETIFAAFFRQSPHLLFDREILHLPDGGCVALDTEDLPPDKRLPADAPALILLPGLTGGSEDTYIQHAVVHARQAGFRAVVFNSRGTSDSPVTTPQFYSASFTDDLRSVVAHVGQQYPGAKLFAAGYSLGANILTRYLGEEGERSPISAAVALCNPFHLPTSSANLKQGFNKVYSRNLGKGLCRIYLKHKHLFEQAAAAGTKPFNTELAKRAQTIQQFDDAITRVSFGFPSVEAYYQASSSSLSVPDVRIPLLVIQAADDPIAPKAAIPLEALQANPNCLLAVTPTGGHLGWCSGRGGPTGAPWTDAAVAEYLVAVCQLLTEPEFAEAARAHPKEPAGVFTQEETTHQAP